VYSGGSSIETKAGTCLTSWKERLRFRNFLLST
jgi:hypothetical protein